MPCTALQPDTVAFGAATGACGSAAPGRRAWWPAAVARSATDSGCEATTIPDAATEVRAPAGAEAREE
eukprot:8385454-Lingulodinium_polyedra.AAC.1